jgi:hypothetical protein
MERYIGTFGNADELMAVFTLAKERSLVQPSPYHYVKTWFHKQFPDYKAIPQPVSGENITPLQPPETDANAELSQTG